MSGEFPERRTRVIVKSANARTKIVQACFPLRATNEAVFRAFAPADFQVLTLAAVRRQCVALGITECLLARRKRHFANMRVANVAQGIRRIHVVVAGIDFAVVLDSERLAAELGRHAGLSRSPHRLHHGRLEQVHEHAPGVLL
jgi:hypothetical protein